jgi:hypothetical protein
MTRVAPVIPADNDILCEYCGYVLNGLPEDGRCPECGNPIADSSATLRKPSAWEERPSLGSFLLTSAQVIFRPTEFFRSLRVRGELRRARIFGWVHWIVTSILLTATAILHLKIVTERQFTLATVSALIGIGILLVFVLLELITRLAAKLTAWEAAYRGYRLPYPVVLRGLYFHAAHYLPIGLLAFATLLISRRALVQYPLHFTYDRYAYVLCAEVILAAGYLFKTYWIGMRIMMYANSLSPSLGERTI